MTTPISTLTADLGSLDGVVRIGHALLVNDWITSTIYEVSTDSDTVEVAQSAAGLGYAAALRA